MLGVWFCVDAVGVGCMVLCRRCWCWVYGSVYKLLVLGVWFCVEAVGVGCMVLCTSCWCWVYGSV